MWWLSGIFRDVYLLALPRTCVWDVGVQTGFDAAMTDATCDVRVMLRDFAAVAGSRS